MTLTFYTSVSKGLKLSQKVLRANCYVCRSYREKTGSGTFCHSSSRTVLKYMPIYTIQNKESLHQGFSLNRKKIFKFYLWQLKCFVYKWKAKGLKKLPLCVEFFGKLMVLFDECNVEQNQHQCDSKTWCVQGPKPVITRN